MSDDTDKVAELASRIRDAIDQDVDERTSQARAIAKLIEHFVSDPCLAPSLIRKVARAADAADERVDELCLLLARFGLARDRGEVRTPAGYFGSSAKRLVVHKWGVPWEEPAREVRIHRAS
jgi:hypothetical protein